MVVEATPRRLVVAATPSSLTLLGANNGDLAKRDGGVAFTLRRRGDAATRTRRDGMVAVAPRSQKRR